MEKKQFKQALKSMFDGVAERYDGNAFFAISASKLAELVPPLNPMKVLDISTGTGGVAIAVARQHQHAEIEGIDLSPGMLARAESKAHEAGLGNISFRQMDVDALPYDKESFEVITCGYALFFYPQMETTYQSICNLVKPGGVFVFSSFTDRAFSPCAKMFIDRIAAEYQVPIPVERMQRLKTRAQVEALAALGDTRRITILHHPIRYPVTIDQWWAQCNNAGFKGLLNQLSNDQLVEFKQDHLSDLETVTADGKLELNADTWFCIVEK